MQENNKISFGGHDSCGIIINFEQLSTKYIMSTVPLKILFDLLKVDILDEVLCHIAFPF